MGLEGRSVSQPQPDTVCQHVGRDQNSNSSLLPYEAGLCPQKISGQLICSPIKKTNFPACRLHRSRGKVPSLSGSFQMPYSRSPCCLSSKLPVTSFIMTRFCLDQRKCSTRQSQVYDGPSHWHYYTTPHVRCIPADHQDCRQFYSPARVLFPLKQQPDPTTFGPWWVAVADNQVVSAGSVTHYCEFPSFTTEHHLFYPPSAISPLGDRVCS